MYGHPIEPGGSFALVVVLFWGLLFRFGKKNKNENKVMRNRIIM